MNMIDEFFGYLGILLIILNSFLFLYSYKKYGRNLSYKFFSFYLICALIVNLVVFILAKYSINNLFLSHYYFISQFILISLFYKSLFNKNQGDIVSVVFLIVISILGFQYIIWPELYFKFNTTEVFLTSFPLVVYSIVHLYNSLNKPGKFIYINAGILIYLSTSTLIFILGDYLSSISNSKAVNNIWFINKVLYVIYLLLILTEWWKNYRLVKNK